MGFVFQFTVKKAKMDAEMDLPLKSTPSLVASTSSSKMMLIVLTGTLLMEIKIFD